MNGLLVAFALIADALIGDPDALWRRLPHPVALMGAAIGRLDARFNREGDGERRRRRAGIAVMIVVTGCSLLAGALIERVLETVPLGSVALVLAAAVLIAQNSLYRHVAAVRTALLEDGLDGGRAAVARIVGRDPSSLDRAGVSRAAIESCAENYADGVVAPALWFFLLGLPGLIACKAINTADSMIGYRTPRHRAFGWAAARLDDLVNWPAARLAALFIAAAAALTGGDAARCLRIARRDAGLHRSPNAGWPEAAFAAALGIALAGPRSYHGAVVEDPYLNPEGRKDAGPGDIARALRLLLAACAVQVAAYAGLGIVAL